MVIGIFGCHTMWQLWKFSITTWYGDWMFSITKPCGDQNFESLMLCWRKNFNHHLMVGVYRVPTKNIWSPSSTPPLFDVLGWKLTWHWTQNGCVMLVLTTLNDVGAAHAQEALRWTTFKFLACHKIIINKKWWRPTHPHISFLNLHSIWKTPIIFP